MSKNKKVRLEPGLRFPEFNGGDWDSEELSELAELIEERSEDKEYTTLSVTSGVGLVSQKEKFGREISGSSYKNYYVIRKWDFAYNKSATKLYPEGYISMLTDREEGAVPNSIFTCFRVNRDKIYPPFLNYLFHDNFHGRWLRKFIEVGARAHGSLSIDTDVLFKLPIVYPSRNEQQKIADCLSSLDALITAENQKLEVLQLHKKGLMQQLFPAEGQKVPRLRFKEFKDSGEWDVTELGHLGELVSGLTYSPEDVRDEGLLVLRSSNIKDSKIALEDCVFVIPEIKGANLTKPNDILVCVRNGSKSLIGKNALIPDGMPLSTHGAFMTVFRASNPKFVFQLFQSDLFKKQVDADLGATINSINGSQLVKYKFTCPKPKEQKKIADFLSSVDELVNAQSEKVEGLKAHKKGLMQQLFPASNEIENS